MKIWRRGHMSSGMNPKGAGQNRIHFCLAIGKAVTAMQSISLLFLLACLTVVQADPTSNGNSAVTNSVDGPHKPSVYVGGAVQKPGRYDWFPGMTVVDAIQVAGGFTDSKGHLALILRIVDGHTIRIKFNADTFPYGAEKPPSLEDGDTVSVPKRIF
jgi:hypothetical protein